jgi:hypothetical protein
MKRFVVNTDFTPLRYEEGVGFKTVPGKSGKEKCYRTRKGVEAFCEKNRCAYVERKFIFYR